MPIENIFKPRKVNGITIIGPDLFAKNEKGILQSPIASILPSKSLLVTGRGIHAMQVASMIDYLSKLVAETGKREFTWEEENEVYRNVVALLVRGDIVLIRSDPTKMDLMFEADELLQKLVPKKQIQFTGVHISEIRDKLRDYGQCWRISSIPRSVAEICKEINSNRVHVGTGTVYYHNVPSGGRFLTCEEFRRIGYLLDGDLDEALRRLKEILSLTELVNLQGVRELSFFLPEGKTIDTKALVKTIECIEGISIEKDIEEARKWFNHFAREFARAAGEDLAVDDLDNVSWRTTMFCRLCDIKEQSVEELALGLSPEFYLNIRWLPGARIVPGKLLFEKNIKNKVKNIITYYFSAWKNLVSVNVGRIETSLVFREDRTDENRAVFVVVLGLAGDKEEIRLVRMAKWDVLHRINRGKSLQSAIEETENYKQYIKDRLFAARQLNISIPDFSEIVIKEKINGIGEIPVFMFERPYVPGFVTDKIPSLYYGRNNFIERFAGLLGKAAAVNMVLGRVNPRNGHMFFDDGDEIIELDNDNLPYKITIAETTGSFADWNTPVKEFVSHCVHHLVNHLEKARNKEIQQKHLITAVQKFCDELMQEINRMKAVVKKNPNHFWTLFADRSQEVGGIHLRWQGILTRLEKTNTEALRGDIMNNPELSQVFAVVKDKDYKI